MQSISVETSALYGVAASLSDLGDQLSVMRQTLDRAELAGYAGDSSEFGEALAGFTGAWTQCLTLMGIGAARLGESAASAAHVYETIDRAAIPASPSHR